MGIRNPSLPGDPPGDDEFPPLPKAGSRTRHASLRAILAYDRCDQFSEALIYFVILFSPWVFGTPHFWSGFNLTHFWATKVLNVAGYAMGLLLSYKLLVRWWLSYKPSRWRIDSQKQFRGSIAITSNLPRILTVGLVILSIAIPGYCLVAAVNARAVYDPVRTDFTYHSHLAWLPHSYDSRRSWQGFVNFTALACMFWAVRDWLLGKTRVEARSDDSSPSRFRQNSILPARLQRLLWVISINGALLGLEGICQRLSGTGKLLWLVQPRIIQTAEGQFGPYAYRSNAAQYFNLVWPVALGFWWTLRREVRHRLRSVGRFRGLWIHGLLLCVLIMAACPIISYSRGGAFVAFGNLTIAAALLLFGMRRRHPLVKFGVLLFLGSILALSLSLSWFKLSERFKETGSGFLGRESMNQTARKIALDYPWFGTGPGTFEPVFQLYRESPEEYWPAQLHNDWLETLITFGWVGSALILLAFVLILARWFFPGNILTGWRFTSLVWVALAGCLLHARFDFPMQVYSILLLFTILCSILFSLSRPQV